MKLEIFTKANLARRANALLLSTLFVFAFAGTMFSQDDCPLVANDLVQVSMDDDCKVGISPDMILEAPGVPASCNYTVVVLGTNGLPLTPHPDTITVEHVGLTLTVEVYLNGNKTWGKIKIEDKSPPVFVCPTEPREAWCWQEPSLDAIPVVENCGTYTIETVSDETVDYDCTNALSAQRIITYQAVDNSGNRSAVCRDTINFRRLTVTSKDDITVENYDGTAGDNPALPCDNSNKWDKNGNGYPDIDEVRAPYVTVPNLNNPALMDTFYFNQPTRFCEFNITHRDDTLKVCTGTFKVLREWTLLDWCSGDIFEVNQVIKVVDEKAPVIACVDTRFKVKTAAYECNGTWDVVAPIMTDACSQNPTYTVSYQHADHAGNFPPDNGGEYTKDNVSKVNNGYKITKLPLGLTKVRYTVKDDCGNIAYAYVLVEVFDETAPNAVCKEFTVASLTSDGTAKVYTESIDDGSYDNCGIKSILVRRMDTNNCPCDVPVYKHHTYKGETGGLHYYVSDELHTKAYAKKHAEALGAKLVNTSTLNPADLKWVSEHVLDTNKDEKVDYLKGDVHYHLENDENWVVADKFAGALTAKSKVADFSSCNISGLSETPYMVHPFKFNEEAYGEFEVTLFNTLDEDSYLLLYEGDFDPTWPCDNLVDYDDDGAGAGYFSKISAILSADKEYTLVVASYRYSDAKIEELYGEYEISIYASSSVLVQDHERKAPYVMVTDQCNFSTHVNFCCADVANDENMVVMRVIDNYGNWNECMVNVRVQDKLAPYITCPKDITLSCGQDIKDYEITGKPEYGDNCDEPTLEVKDLGELSQCGTGTIRRVFKVTDAGGRSVSCTQVITVIDKSPFNGDDIKWPANIDFEGCAKRDVKPENTGKPTYDDDECSLIASSYEDQTFTFAEDACSKILRTWTVIDWCTYDQNNPKSEGYWQSTQIIKINNTVKPKFDSCKDYTVGIYGANCTGAVTFSQNATDDCTAAESLKYYYEIDLNGDGVITAADAKGNTNSVTMDLAPGTYKVWWKVEDLCGNVDRCEQIVTVVDAKKPTPYCRGEVVTVVMPSTMMIDIWASDFNIGSTDNCSGELKVSFSKDVNDTRRDFTCAEVGKNELEVWITDAAGNQDYCTVTVVIQPNQACGEGRVSGHIKTEYNAPVKEVEVTLNNMSSSEKSTFKTNSNGVFQFTALNSNSNYMVAPQKESDARNGVNTRDLITIQRHLLGISKLDSPYKLIAADANNDKTVSPQDLLELRKLILRINEKLPNNKSWRFVKSDFVFANPNSPFVFDEQIEVKEVGENSTDENFIAVKIGDVNGSADLKLEAGAITEPRSSEEFVLAYDFDTYGAGEIIEVPVYAGADGQIAGIQYDMKLEGVEVLEVQSGAMHIEPSFYHVHKGNFAMSWNTVESERFAEGDVLFTLVLRAENSGSTAGLFIFDESTIKAEAYSQDLSIMKIGTSLRNENFAGSFMVEQNNPNPFIGSTVINVQLPSSGILELTVYDLTGKKVYTDSKLYSSGRHAITLDSEEISASGVMYYQVTYGGDTVTKKMISIGK